MCNCMASTNYFSATLKSVPSHPNISISKILAMCVKTEHWLEVVNLVVAKGDG